MSGNPIEVIGYMAIAEHFYSPGATRKMAEEIGLEIIKEANTAIIAFMSPSMSDVDGISDASNKIKEFIDENQPNRLLFDFERVKFFSSQVLGLLLDIRAKLEKYNGKVVISAINPQLHRVFKITNLDKVFKFFPDRESAIK
jgi:anti-sigma B factor antagonist